MTAKVLQIPVCCCRPALQMFTRLDVGAAAGPLLSLAGPDGENENFQTSCSHADVRCLKHNQSPPMSLMRSHPQGATIWAGLHATFAISCKL